MFFLLFDFFRVQWPFLCLLLCLLPQLLFPHLLTENVIIVFGLEFVSIELVNCISLRLLTLLDFLVHLIINDSLIYLLLPKFDHQGAILVRSLIKHGNRMHINCLIKDNILDLPFAFAS